jgi:ribonuclease-3 family protein
VNGKYSPYSPAAFTKEELKNAAPLALSFVGDAVHTLYVRTKLFGGHPYGNSELHNLTSAEVCASRQARLAEKMETYLGEDEKFIFKKAKNAKVNSVPKHAALYDYKLATAFEAVLGYLYLSGENVRLEFLFEAVYGIAAAETDKKETAK